VTLLVLPPLGQQVFCDISGGQLSVTLPNGHIVHVAGYPGTPDVPLFGDGFPFTINTPIAYVASSDDLSSGVLIARADYGSTAHLPNQVNGIYHSFPPNHTANAVSSQANNFAPACPGDIAGNSSGPGHNGLVNIDDLLMVIQNWGAVGNPGIPGDIAPIGTPNGTVDVDDLLVIISTWGQCP
jgi:hypothetical protein